MARIRPTAHLLLAILLSTLGGGASTATTQQPGQNALDREGHVLAAF